MVRCRSAKPDRWVRFPYRSPNLEENKMINLVEYDRKQKIEDFKYIKVYMTHCTGCSIMDRTLGELEGDVEFNILNVNGNVHPDITDKFMIRSAPCLIRIDSNGVEDNFKKYQGPPNDKEGIVAFLKELS